MNTNNLSKNQVIKNYKELCGILEEPVKNGKAKKIQLEEFSGFFRFERDKNKYIIIEIYDEPKPKEANTRNNQYGDLVQELIIHELSLNHGNSPSLTINMSKNRLFFKLHMINHNYNLTRNNIKFMSEYMNIPTATFFDFFNNTSSKLRGTVERALNNLESRCLLMWEYRVQLKMTSGIHRLATDKEMQTIKKIEKEILNEIGYENKKDIFISGKWELFSNRVSKKLNKAINSDYYYKVFHINATDSFIEMLLEDEKKESIRGELNAKIYNSTIKTAENHHQKMEDKYRLSMGIPKYIGERNVLKPEYIDDTKRIANTVIDDCASFMTMQEITEGMEFLKAL